MATIRNKGPGQWHVQIRRKGWPYRTRTFRTKKDAEIWSRSIEGEMDRGIHSFKGHDTSISLGKLIEQYIEQVTLKRPGEDSIIAEQSRLRRFLREEPELCAYAVSHLQPEHFIDYRNRRLQQPSPRKAGIKIAPGTVKRELTLLKRVIDFKKREFGIPINPVNTEDVARPVVNDERDVRLGKSDIAKLLTECYAAKNLLLGPIVEFAIETGARQGSLRRLEWSNINYNKRTIVFERIKNSRNPNEQIDHVTALSPRAIEILKGVPKTDKRIFPISRTALDKAFQRAKKRAGITNFHFHDIRHERVSNLFENGWSMMNVMAISGHKDPKSLKRYANLDAEYLADELAKLGSTSDKN